MALEDAIWLLEAAEGRGFAATDGLGGGIVLYSPPKRLAAKRQGMLGDCGVQVEVNLRIRKRASGDKAGRGGLRDCARRQCARITHH